MPTWWALDYGSNENCIDMFFYFIDLVVSYSNDDDVMNNLCVVVAC